MDYGKALMASIVVVGSSWLGGCYADPEDPLFEDTDVALDSSALDPAGFGSAAPRCVGDISKAAAVFCSLNANCKYATCQCNFGAQNCYAADLPDMVTLYGYTYDIRDCKSIDAYVPCWQ